MANNASAGNRASFANKALKFIKKHYIALIILIAVIGGIYYYYKKKQAGQGQVQYITTVAEKGALTSSVLASGSVIVDQSSNVDPTINGTVADLAVAVGDSVKKGQFLFNIINGDLTVSVAKSVASLEQSQNSVEDAKITVKSAKAEYDAAKKKEDATPGTYTNKQLKVLKAKIDSAEDGVIEAEKNLTATQADYTNTLSDASKRKVTAAIDGTVNVVNIKNGDDLSKLSSGSSRQVPIIIGNLGTLKAQVQVNEVDVASVAIGQKVMLKFSAVDSLVVSGQIEKMDSLGTTSQNVVTYNVTIGFDTIDSHIKPGMSVTASIIIAVKQNVITVPNSAVKNQENNYYVQVLVGQAPQSRTVEIGVANTTDIEITSGVNVGDNVVTQTINPNATTSTSSTSSANRTGGGGGFRLPGLGGGRPPGD